MLPGVARGQNVSNYGEIPDPFLFLLREPAVHEDLGLSTDQKSQLRSLNEEFDASLLSSRNKSPEEAQTLVDEARSASQRRVAQIFTDQQEERLRQITWRLRGISFVLGPDASEELALSSRQRASIQEIVDETRESVAAQWKILTEGQTTAEAANSTVMRVRREEQRRVLAELTANQRRRLPAMLGREFDPAELGRTSFKAPELSNTGVWFNSESLQLSELRGKVVALHFWAFG